MNNKITLSEKRASSKRRLTKLSGLFGMGFVLMLLALFTTQCKEDDFTGEVVSVCPQVILTNPQNGALNVVTTKIVSATFNVSMEPTSVDETTFILKKGGSLVSGSVTYNGLIATFSPTNILSPNTVYSATIKRNVTDLHGNIMRNDTTWSFNTGTSPEVILTDPTQGASDVALNKVITADFSTAMDPLSISSSTFYVKQGANLIAGTLTYAGVKASFTPLVNLITNKVYTVTITKGAKDVAGNALVRDTTWSFATGVLPIITVTDPLNNATNVAVNKKVNVTFSKVMSVTTINLSTFIVKQGANVISGIVTYQDMTATFSPTAALLPGVEYTATVTNGVKDLLNNSIVKDSTWKFTTSVLIIPILPYVVSTDPTNLAINVPYNKVISATFSKAMDPTTINSSTFKLMNGTTPVLGFVTYTGLVASFTPAAPLLPGTVYTATITTGVKDNGDVKAQAPILPGQFNKVKGTTDVTEVDGNAMAANYTWTFTTIIAVMPEVVSTDPAQGASDVPLNKVITADFNTAMNPSTINTGSFVVKQGANIVVGTVSYSGVRATFTPTVKLEANKVYTVNILKDVKDLAGNSMVNHKSWSFSTEHIPTITSTSPQDEAVNVATNREVIATFSKVMNASTIDLTTFTLKQGGNAILGVVTYNNMTATFNPTLTLLSNVEYTATIKSSVKDLSNNSLAKDSTWKFTTSVFITPVLPFVVSTDPNNLAVNVPLDKSITATFSKAMNATTINATTYKLMNGLTPVTGVVTYVGMIGTFNPSSPLIASTTYTATITTGVKDMDGNNMVVDKTWSFKTAAPIISGPAGIDLGAAGRFAILAGAGVTNTGLSIVTGDVGSHPTATINGFPPGIVNGILYTVADPLVGNAKTALTAAFNDAAGRTIDQISMPGNLGGLTLTPGLYKSGSTSGITGSGANAILTLDAQGNPNAVWIFIMPTSFTTGTGTSIVLKGNAQAKNIYWSVGSSATLGTYSTFYGNILADQSITLETGATLNGRALTRVAAVTLDANIVNRP